MKNSHFLRADGFLIEKRYSQTPKAIDLPILVTETGLIGS